MKCNVMSASFQRILIGFDLCAFYLYLPRHTSGIRSFFHTPNHHFYFFVASWKKEEKQQQQKQFSLSIHLLFPSEKLIDSNKILGKLIKMNKFPLNYILLFSLVYNLFYYVSFPTNHPSDPPSTSAYTHMTLY